MEETSSERTKQLEQDPLMVVWWGTSVEVESALFRRSSNSEIDVSNAERARTRLTFLSNSWIEIQPTDSIREMAKRLIRVHGLRSADSLQLAAALGACGNHPKNQNFLTGDQNLKRAATKEGFSCL
jgi:predicted nucleic acid-binding protein